LGGGEKKERENGVKNARLKRLTGKETFGASHAE